MIFLISSCQDVEPYVIDTDSGEVVGKEERFLCTDPKAKKIACFDEKGIEIISKCLKRCRVGK